MVEELLGGKRGLICGVANRRSLAWSIAQALAGAGAQLAFTYQGERLRKKVEDVVSKLPGTHPVYPCDVTRDEEIQATMEGVQKDLGGLDILVHAIAFADRKDLEQDFVETSRAGFLLAQEVSAHSLGALAREASRVMTDGGSIITLTYLGGEQVVPGYNVMGVAKAALESSLRYLAHNLGPKKIRVNGISAGPVNTLAARGIAGFAKILDVVAERAPLKRNVEPREVADTALFLASDLSSGITGEVIHVDCGFHIMGM